jgi:hypothetical protein
MKTQIITLESHDDLISVRDRMSWAKTPRILLIWPKYEKVTLRQVDLKILQRHASTLGAQLGLVTRRRRVRLDAEALNIPVFESTGKAQRVAWPQPASRRLPRRVPDRSLREKREQVQVREEAWRSSPITRIVAFTVGVLSVFALLATFVPRAQVTLKPVTEPQSVSLPVIANPSVDSVFITGNIPAREIRIVVDGTHTVTVTGEGILPQSKAKGVVEFRNLTQDAVTIPAGTVVVAKGVRFVTTESGEVDAGVGKTIELPVEAVERGISGNVDSETINAIEGRLGLLLAVTNRAPTEGGRERMSGQADDSDRARAKDLLLRSLENEARKQLAHEVDPGDVVFTDTFALSQILSEVYDPPPGAAGEKLTLTMRAEYSVRYASASDLTELAALALNSSLPPGYLAASDSLSVEPSAKPVTLANGSTRWVLRAERQIVQRIDPAQVTRTILGMNVKSAQKELGKNLPLANPPTITFVPSWWRWIPIVPFRVEVVTE